jgi:hypothetical protein
MHPDVPHVADIKKAHAGPHRHMLGNNPAKRRVFNGHIPAVKLHHFRAHLPMNGVQSSLGRSSSQNGQKNLDDSAGAGLQDKNLLP